MAAVSVVLAAVVAVIHLADGSLLGMEADQPGFLASLRMLLASGLAMLWLGFGALVLGRRIGFTRPLLVVLLVVATGARAAVWLAPAAPHRASRVDRLESSLATDLETWAHAAVALGRRVSMAVGEHERVAIVHPTVQHDFPLFLTYTLCPRIFFSFAEAEPSQEAVRELGIDWILDVRHASADTRYAGAVLRRAKP